LRSRNWPGVATIQVYTLVLNNSAVRVPIRLQSVAVIVDPESLETK
jgi:hypothetical protein